MCVWSSRMRSRQQHCMWQRHFICCLFEWKMTDCDPIRPPVSGPRERAGEYEETSAAARINLLHQIKLAGINPHQMGRMCREHSSVRKPRQDVCLSGEWGSPQDQDGCQRRQSACRSVADSCTDCVKQTEDPTDVKPGNNDAVNMFKQVRAAAADGGLLHSRVRRICEATVSA